MITQLCSSLPVISIRQEENVPQTFKIEADSSNGIHPGSNDLFFVCHYLSHLSSLKKGKGIYYYFIFRCKSDFKFPPEGSDRFANKTTRFVSPFGAGGKNKTHYTTASCLGVRGVPGQRWQECKFQIQPRWCLQLINDRMRKRNRVHLLGAERSLLHAFLPTSLTSLRYSAVHLLPFYFTGNDR